MSEDLDLPTPQTRTGAKNLWCPLSWGPRNRLPRTIMVGVLGFPQLRYHSPWVQNLISGIGVGASAGIYVALNLLGAGGGR